MPALAARRSPSRVLACHELTRTGAHQGPEFAQAAGRLRGNSSARVGHFAIEPGHAASLVLQRRLRRRGEGNQLGRRLVWRTLVAGVTGPGFKGLESVANELLGREALMVASGEGVAIFGERSLSHLRRLRRLIR